MESSDEDELAVVCLITSLVKQKRVRKRRVWSKEWIEAHLTQGPYHSLVKELRLTDSYGYRNFLRMNTESFDLLLKLVIPIITKIDTNIRRSISAEERLAVTLRWLASGT